MKRQLLAFVLAICLMLPLFVSCDGLEDLLQDNKQEEKDDSGKNNKNDKTDKTDETDDRFEPNETVSDGDVLQTTERGDSSETERSIANIEIVGNVIIITYTDGTVKYIERPVDTDETETAPTYPTECPSVDTAEPPVDETIEDAYLNHSYYVSVSGEGDTFRFVPNVSGYYEIYSYNCSGDPVVDLYDAYGLEIGYSDDGDGLNFRLDCYLTAGETYYINVRALGSSASYYFTIDILAVETTEVPITEPPVDETIEDVYAYYSYYVSVSGEGEYFRFVPNTSGWYEIYSYDRYGDPSVYLYDANWYQLAYNDDGNDGLNFSLEIYLTAGETYYIKTCALGSSASYYFTINRVVMETTEMPTEFPTTEPPVDDTIEDVYLNYSYYVSVSGEGDVFRFVPEESGWYEIYSYDCSGDPVVDLYDANWNFVGSNDDGNGGRNFRLEYYFTAGEVYYINVRAYNSGSASYCFTIEHCVMTHEEYMDADIDDLVVIEAYVQATQSWWDNKITAYLQAEDGAYFVYEMACSEEDAAKLTKGTKIRVTGYKGEWAGEIEIMGATFEILEGYWVAEAFDATELLGTYELITHQNEFVRFTGLTIAYIEHKYGEPGDDIYVGVSYNGDTYRFCVERYLTGPETEVYQAISALQVGDIVDIEGFLYWYEGVNTQITAVSKHEFVGEDVYVDSSKYVSVSENGTVFRFIPQYSGTYNIYSYNNSGDPFVYLYDEYWNQLEYNDDGNGGGNFRLQYYFVAGETYYINVCAYNYRNASYWFVVESLIDE